MRKIIIYLVVLVMLSFVTLQCKKSTEVAPDDGTVYFLVSEITPSHGDSFVLPLTNPADIAAADSIAGGARPQIVSAVIARGSGNGNYRNKDILSAGGRLWSWHVVQFDGFVDISAEIYDGWPTYVENNLNRWMEQNEGRIGFWSYTVTRRLTAEEAR